ncbi:MAG: dihydropteroate synthase [Actinomycetota bacterium]|nr:dihydropteroate synthase [Actinomycetota bacterium]
MALDWRLSDRVLRLDRPLGVGIVNVTSDSMFSGARSETPENAIADGLRLARAGFDMLDLGAVAARSGPAVEAGDEASRLLPAIEGLAAVSTLPISADTFSAKVAAGALEAGAVAINDISGALDPALFELAAETACGLVLMHIEGRPREDREPPRFDDPIDHLKGWFAERIEAASARGVEHDQIVLDPGLDFDLGVATGLEVLRRLGELHELGRPIYLSLSRKDLLGAVLAGSWEARLPPERRQWASCAATALAVSQGAQIHRLHDPSALQAMRVAAAVRGGEAAALPYTEAANA